MGCNLCTELDPNLPYSRGASIKTSRTFRDDKYPEFCVKMRKDLNNSDEFSSQEDQDETMD